MSDIPEHWYERLPIGTTKGGWLILNIEREPKRNRIMIRVRCTGCNDVEALRSPFEIERPDASNWCRQCAAKHRLARDGAPDGIYDRTPDPTPEEIRAICDEIQSEWTASDRRRRNTRRTYSIPTAKVHG